MVGKVKAQKLARLGIETIGDLVTYFPRDYEDRSSEKKVAELMDGDECSVFLTVLSDVTANRPRPKLSIYKTIAGDDSGIINLVWFNQTYIKGRIIKGNRYIFYGKVKKRGSYIEITNPIFEDENAVRKKTTGIQPIYSLTEGISQYWLRMVQRNALDLVIGKITEIMPDELRSKYSLTEVNYSLEKIHFPSDFSEKDKARKRLVFEELLMLQLGLLHLKKSQAGVSGIKFEKKQEIARFINDLPFRLTNAQYKVYNEIEKDMTSEKQMNRLVQGDVGSGKTIVAVIAILLAALNGFQAVFMVPTEILAEQHFRSIEPMLNKYGIKTALLTGSATKKEKELIKDGIRNRELDVIVGTHALLEGDVVFHSLGLVVTDEQHRFGVKQRAVLSSKSNPDILVMTATPIPRTLALILYGDLDISVIDELPPNRKPVETYAVGENMRQRIYRFIRKKVQEGRQAYIICPLVEESEEIEAEAAMTLARKLEKEDLNGLSIGLIHGKMKYNEKESIMREFSNGKIQVLVSTTVVEVGVNVPNACVMVVENAERFGLAQLHQLRGRVGRGEHQSYCILICKSRNEIAGKRMEIMTKYTDGFKISEKDMELRGPGDIFGVRQHGLPEFKIANLYEDMELLKEAQKAALDIAKHQKLEGREDYKKLYRHLSEVFRGKMQEVALN
jgi:ATP-dependent DNA helicase RecG